MFLSTNKRSIHSFNWTIAIFCEKTIVEKKNEAIISIPNCLTQDIIIHLHMHIEVGRIIISLSISVPAKYQ